MLDVRLFKLFFLFSFFSGFIQNFVVAQDAEREVLHFNEIESVLNTPYLRQPFAFVEEAQIDSIQTSHTSETLYLHINLSLLVSREFSTETIRGVSVDREQVLFSGDYDESSHLDVALKVDVQRGLADVAGFAASPSDWPLVKFSYKVAIAKRESSASSWDMSYYNLKNVDFSFRSESTETISWKLYRLLVTDELKEKVLSSSADTSIDSSDFAESLFQLQKEYDFDPSRGLQVTRE